MACHLSFVLKHEGVHLETLSRLFAAVPALEIETWIRDEPTGQYARRAGFLYEFLTGKHLDITDSRRGNYIPALDTELELTSATPVNNARWRVRDNLPGAAAFSPQVYLTPDIQRALTLDVRERITQLEGQFSAGLVLRSAVETALYPHRTSSRSRPSCSGQTCVPYTMMGRWSCSPVR